jgi:hypothetical protein
VGLERGPLSLVKIIEELFQGKSIAEKFSFELQMSICMVPSSSSQNTDRNTIVEQYSQVEHINGNAACQRTVVGQHCFEMDNTEHR